MADSTHQDIVTMLALQEEAVAALYSVFAVKLPDMREFWNKIVGQEKLHARILHAITKLIEQGEAYLDEHKFNITAIQTNVNYIQKCSHDASAKGITDIKALSIALDIENGLMEKEYFRVIKSDDLKIQRDLKAVEDQTEQHRADLKKMLNEIRGKKS